MFNFFSNTKINALEMQIDLLNQRLKEMEDKFAKIEEATNMSQIESNIDTYVEQAIERAMDDVDLEDKARDALESLVSYARVSIDF